MDKKSKMKKMINRFVLIYLQGHLHLIVTIESYGTKRLKLYLPNIERNLIKCI